MKHYRWPLASAWYLSTFTLLFICSTPRIALSDEIWMGSDRMEGIGRYDLDGNLIGSINSNETSAMALVGGEVWTTHDEVAAVTRFSLQGDYLGTFSTDPITAMVVVGNEVWTGYEKLFAGDEEDPVIRRYNYQGDLIGTIASYPTSAMVVVGDEIWTTGQSGPRRRYSFDGDYLGDINEGGIISTMIVVGDEVWTSHEAFTLWITRLTFEGEFIDRIDSGSVSSMVVVDDEVWAGRTRSEFALRYNFEGASIWPGLATQWTSTMLYIPEPRTIIVFCLIVSMLLKQRVPR